MQAANPFNPCSDVPEDEQIPAKIWELLRRNKYFRAAVQRLSELDSKERSDWTTHGKYHGAAWQKSCRLVKRVQARHPFAGLALQWLVPEPFFQIRRVTWPLGKHWRKRAAVSPR